MADLTPKHQRFVEGYVVGLNATQAAIRADYSAKTANREGSQSVWRLRADRHDKELRSQRRVGQRCGAGSKL
nr:terminase small subunit [Mesorhizobium alhagi]